MIFRTIGVAATALLLMSAPAMATTSNPETWHWGSFYSADRAGKAKGKVVLDRPGFVVSGKLYDFPNKAGCSWLKFRWVKENGTKGAKTFHNCSGTKPLKFAFGTGYMLSIEARVCRGTSSKITGKCSIWEGVWAQGG